MNRSYGRHGIDGSCPNSPHRFYKSHRSYESYCSGRYFDLSHDPHELDVCPTSRLRGGGRQPMPSCRSRAAA